MRLVGDAAARVIADGARLEPGFQRSRQVARGAVIAGDDDRRLCRLAVEQRGEQVGPQGLRDERAAAVAGERCGLRVLVGVLREER